MARKILKEDVDKDYRIPGRMQQTLLLQLRVP